MKYLNYKRLLNVAHSTNPYRGSTNRFPIGSRRENRKYFLLGTENNEPVMSIVYGDRYSKRDITKDEYNEYMAQGKAAGHSSATGEYFTWDKGPNYMGLVRSDNSFQFHGKYYSQGEHMFLSSCAQGYFNTDSRRGGMIYKVGKAMYPIYHGMKVDCETMRPLDKDIVITGKAVNRKEGKNLLKQYDDFYKVCEVMCKSMDSATFIATATSIYNEYKSVDDDALPTELAFKLADSLLQQAPFDALILYEIALDVNNIRWQVRHGTNYYSNVQPSDMFNTIKRRLNTYLYKQNKEVFSPVHYEMGDYLPASQWGYTITVGGVEVVQY